MMYEYATVHYICFLFVSEELWNIMCPRDSNDMSWSSKIENLSDYLLFKKY